MNRQDEAVWLLPAHNLPKKAAVDVIKELSADTMHLTPCSFTYSIF